MMPVPFHGPARGWAAGVEDPGWATFWCAAVLAFAAGWFVRGVLMLLVDLSTRRWQPVDARWVDFRMEVWRIPGKGFEVFTPVVAFEYDTPEGPRVSTCVGRDPRDYCYMSRADAERLLAGAEIGRPVTVFVDPRRVEQPAVLRRVPSPARRSRISAAVIGGPALVMVATEVHRWVVAAAAA